MIYMPQKFTVENFAHIWIHGYIFSAKMAHISWSTCVSEIVVGHVDFGQPAGVGLAELSPTAVHRIVNELTSSELDQTRLNSYKLVPR
jgi:hypothetical protein